MRIRNACGVLVYAEKYGHPLVLAIKRWHPPLIWAVPCGRQEQGETLEETAIRETLEETGAVVDLTGRSFNQMNGQRWRVTIFEATLTRWEQPTTPNEGTPAWVSPQIICTGRYKDFNQRLLEHFKIPYAGQINATSSNIVRYLF